MPELSKPTGVLFIGSVPLDSTEEVLDKLSSALVGRLRSIPDGEPGSRGNYIGWQHGCFPIETMLAKVGGLQLPDNEIYPEYTIESIKPTKYDDAAISSYQQFLVLREKGVIPPEVRFQVSLPPPFDTVQGFVRGEFFKQIEPLYEQRLKEALDRIVKEIPAKDLAIQWDCCFDVMALEYEKGKTDNSFFKPQFTSVKNGLLERFSRLCADIPSDTQLAFHLCYGDLGHRHFIEPEDTSLLVDMANSITKTIGNEIHPVEWFHMPVPKNRTDAAYFEPLNLLELNGSYLYLGLVHSNDEEGTEEKVRIAQEVYKRPFGVATECGLGRTPKEELESVLQICKSVSKAW